MNHDDSDDLDRAIFSLPLAEPPPGLRAAILRATAFAPLSTPAPFGRWEIIAIGVCLALAAWIGIASLTSGAGTAMLTGVLSGFLRQLATPGTVVWLGVGFLTAAWFSLIGTAPLRLPFGPGRTS